MMLRRQLKGRKLQTFLKERKNFPNASSSGEPKS